MTKPDALRPLFQKAGRLLARRPYSRGELRDRLLRAAEAADVEEVLDRLESLRLLNDAEYAYNFAAQRIRLECWGPLKVEQALERRRVPPDAIAAALERVEAELGEETALESFVDKCCRTAGVPRDRREIHRMIQRLRRRGFHDESIRSVLRKRIPAAAWRHFDTGE